MFFAVDRTAPAGPRSKRAALSVAIGTKACESDRTVTFVRVLNLVIEMKKAMGPHWLTACEKPFEKFDLVVLDDLGYCTDVAEFRVPAGKVYLSSVIDCFDGNPWAGRSPSRRMQR